MTGSYYRYWGKARPEEQSGSSCHLLPYHNLDVAAVGQVALRTLPEFHRRISEELEVSSESLGSWLSFLLSVHDIGKFARKFQALAPDLLPAVDIPHTLDGGAVRHDNLGHLLWRRALAKKWLNERGAPGDSRSVRMMRIWLRAVMGHHGLPPEVKSQSTLLAVESFFLDEDVEAAFSYLVECDRMFLGPEFPLDRFVDSSRSMRLKRLSWQLAGFFVLCDWIGSSQNRFPYDDKPRDLTDYWRDVAVPRASRAFTNTGIGASRCREFTGARDLFPMISELTPLQACAESVPLDDNPRIFVLEDVTGAGKTEAALILAHRLLAQGRARGVYIALPTMATANAMYERVARAYRTLFEAGVRPTLVLSHGARHLSDSFRSSILAEDTLVDELSDHESATAVCSAWLADSRKKAFLADVGVGTIDQALQMVLPIRHQSLRALGLADKVVIVDEVHSYDPYMRRILGTFLKAHADHGGSSILLSATLSKQLKREFLGSVGEVGDVAEPLSEDFPILTKGGPEIVERPVATRPICRREVGVEFAHCDEEVVAMIAEAASDGACVCWVRNTVDDAHDAFRKLCDHPRLDSDRIDLFHARFALKDRLRIEREAIEAFGPQSSEDRVGRVLVATQVVEQSLDLDFDFMVSDLAPIDLLIQRAGRLHRHQRGHRGRPVLKIFAPKMDDSADETWYRQTFPKAHSVYRDTARLWTTQKVLMDQGAIRTPEGLRHLIEEVYQTDPVVPDGLVASLWENEGERRAQEDMAQFNALIWEKGYERKACQNLWDEAERIPTRLGEDTRKLVVVVRRNSRLEPLYPGEFGWDLSAVNVRARLIDELAPSWQRRYADELNEAVTEHRHLKYCLLLPAESEGQMSGLRSRGARKGTEVDVRYSARLGLEFVGRSHRPPPA